MIGNIYIGWDEREGSAYRVAEYTLRKHASIPLNITKIDARKLEALKMLTRPLRYQGRDRPIIDVISEAPISTAFANARFFAPLLAQKGWCLFLDCDVVCYADVAPLFLAAAADDEHAVRCVQHAPMHQAAGTKMDGQQQTTYARKNWSSVMLFNCDHPANGALTFEAVNGWRGRDLHRFAWLSNDGLIGELHAGWNWLVNVQPRPDPLYLAHFTTGGPWLAGWEPAAHDRLWLDAEADRVAGR